MVGVALRQVTDSGAESVKMVLESCQKVTFAAFEMELRVVSVFTNKQIGEPDPDIQLHSITFSEC